MVDNLVHLWRDFRTLMLALRANPEDDEYLSPDMFHHHAKLWAQNFRCVTFDEVNCSFFTDCFITSSLVGRGMYCNNGLVLKCVKFLQGLIEPQAKETMPLRVCTVF